MQTTTFTDPTFVAYLLVFGTAAVANLASTLRARRVEDPDTRRGLVALLLTSGSWAAAHVAFLVVPGADLKYAFYEVGLVVGFAAVGPWLYFCSAYTGRSLHRNRSIRLVAVLVFLVVTAVKLTNPLHGLYFTAEVVQTPFPHLAVQSGTLHWLTMGFAYAVSAVGYFMLLELFVQVGHDTRPLAVLLALTGAPVLLDVVSLYSPALIDVTYEPLGVAVFAVGVLSLYLSRFETVQLAGRRDSPVLVLNQDGRLRDYNRSARELFPELAGENVLGTPLREVLPQVTDRLEEGHEEFVLERERGGETRYYRASRNQFTADGRQIGEVVGFTDATGSEEYRRELERQNERLERFASVLSHDLRNPLTVANARIEFAREDHDSEDLRVASDALDRIGALIDDVLALTRQGRGIDETRPVALSSLAEDCWTLVDTGEADLLVESDLSFLADPSRLQQLLENLFRNAMEHGSTDGSSPTVRVGALADGRGFYVADDGPGVPPEDRETVFESGYTTAGGGTGFGLAIVAEIAEAHGWDVRVTESEDGGARFEVTGVTPADTPTD